MLIPFVPTETSETDTDQRVILNMAVACEDTGSALRAKALFEQIKRRLGPDFEIQSVFWTFAEMEIAELKARAEGDFASADILVISYRGDGLACGLPNCLADLLAQRSAQARALVTLEGSQRTATGANLSAQYFREASAQAGVDFFSETEWTMNQRNNCV